MYFVNSFTRYLKFDIFMFFQKKKIYLSANVQNKSDSISIILVYQLLTNIH